jgi:DNA-binding CsgD family transcriptional regulator
MKHIHPMTDEPTRFPVTDLFNGLSKGELVAALSFMHRILGADKRRDLEQLVTELPSFFTRRTSSPHIGPHAGERSSLRGERPSKGGHTYYLFNYIFSCLSKARARIESAQSRSAGLTKRACRLSPRELTVLLWMKEGKTNWEIARILGLSERTVRFHVGGIFEKLDVTSRTQAVARALGAGLIAS